MRLPRPSPSTMGYVALALAASAPAWIVRYPPIQDLPFHLSTIRVIFDFHNPHYAFDTDFALTLGRTQYIAYYLLGSALAYVVGVRNASVLLVSAYLGGMVLALRDLLKALGKDERLCIFAVPLLVNVMFLLGLLPFLLGIPLMFLALASAVRYFEQPSTREGVLLGGLSVALFYSHIFPFGIFGLGFAAMFPWREPKRWLRAGAPTAPALAVLAWWTLGTDAGKLTTGALTSPAPQDHVLAPSQAIPALYTWLTNVFQDNSDEVVLIAFVVVAVVSLGLAQGDEDRSHALSRPYTLLPVACILLYFVTGEGHGYIWLISQRFPILFFFTSIPLLRMPTGPRGYVATGCALVVAAASTLNTCRHFIAFQLEEVGDIDEAIAAMQPRKRVAALIYDRGSHIVNFAPFLHFGSYYQSNKGGVVQFTYAGYAHWPFTFRPGRFPPPGGPARLRWEWTPEAVSVRGELERYYDYVLVRGAGFSPPPGTFHVAWRGDRWTVWERDNPRQPG